MTPTNTRDGGMFHGFTMGAFLPAAAQAFDDVTSVIRKAFASEVVRYLATNIGMALRAGHNDA